jgi:hypothetical protein
MAPRPVDRDPPAKLAPVGAFAAHNHQDTSRSWIQLEASPSSPCHAPSLYAQNKYW